MSVAIFFLKATQNKKEKKLQFQAINPFPNKLWIYVSAVQVVWKHCGKRRNCL